MTKLPAYILVCAQAVLGQATSRAAQEQIQTRGESPYKYGDEVRTVEVPVYNRLDKQVGQLSDVVL